MSMELKLLTPEEQWISKGIQWNNEELKTAIATKMKDYVGLQYTEETIKEAKKDKANLNKLRTAIEDERKRIKKQCMAPYQEFEKQVKEIVVLIDKPIALIDKQIKEVDEQKKAEKKEKIIQIYKENIGNLKDIFPFKRIFKDEYLNASKSMKSITEEITTVISKAKGDIKVIEELDTKYELQVKDMYIKTLDLSMALHENARLEEVARKTAEERAKREAAAREAEKAKEELTKDINIEPVPQVEKPKQEVVKEVIQEAALEEVTVDFRVRTSVEKLMALKAFLRTNNIEFGPVNK